MKPWREVAVPHRDVLEGTFQQSEFAADITAVKSGKASRDYQDAVAFYERTFITEGMAMLLTQVAQRLAGKGGEPVVQLQTAFGGGKTHTMLAVYHLATRKCALAELSGIPALVDRAGLMDVPQARVAVIDGTDRGPSQPRMLGMHQKPESKDGQSLEPIVSYQIQSMSIGYLIDEETPMIWRGPMVTQALEQLLKDTNWRDLDYLIIDLPPGTGDIQLTLAQKIPVSGAVIVTTPQDIALLDARKGLKMFEKVHVPVLGVVENMSVHICSHCGHEEPIFGQGGGLRMAQQYGVDFLGGIPLDSRIREDTDLGNPTVVREPDGRVAQIYRDIARRAAAKLSLKSKDYSVKFPSIVVKND